MFPILPNLSTILDHQKTKGGGYEPGSGAKWDWGWRIHPVTGDRKWHNGLDLPAPTGTTIHAPLAGKVSRAQEDPVSGKYIKLAHDSPDSDIIETVYCHLSAFAPRIQAGTMVTAGQLIGYVGSTGRSTGPHLHFIIRTRQGETYQGVHHRDTDPLPYLEGKKNFAGVGVLAGGLGLAALLYWWYSRY